MVLAAALGRIGQAGRGLRNHGEMRREQAVGLQCDKRLLDHVAGLAPVRPFDANPLALAAFVKGAAFSRQVFGAGTPFLPQREIFDAPVFGTDRSIGRVRAGILHGNGVGAYLSHRAATANEDLKLVGGMKMDLL